MWLLTVAACAGLTSWCWTRRQERSESKWRVAAALAVASAIGVVALLPQQIILQKLANRMVMPCGLVWLGLWTSIGYACKRGQPRIAAELGGVLLLLSVLGNDWIAHHVSLRLEAPYAGIQPLESGHFDAVFVLGGATNTAPNGLAQLEWGGDRVTLAARMFHRGQVDHLITTGERIDGLHMIGRDPSQETAEIWRDLGVPDDRIFLLEGRNTREEMEGVERLAKEHGWRRMGLLTSAGHMPRALRLAEKHGLELAPLPANFEGLDTPWTELSLVPDSASLYTTQKALKEYLAWLVGG